LGAARALIHEISQDLLAAPLAKNQLLAIFVNIDLLDMVSIAAYHRRELPDITHRIDGLE
jgi:hypothetical protein